MNSMYGQRDLMNDKDYFVITNIDIIFFVDKANFLDISKPILNYIKKNHIFIYKNLLNF